MAVKLRRPILLGGLGLTFGIWLLESVYPTVSETGGQMVWGAIALGSGAWWLKRRVGKTDAVLSVPAAIDRGAVEAALTAVSTKIEQLKTELTDQSDAAFAEARVEPWREQLRLLTAEMDRTEAQVTLLGGQSVGKTTLLKRLADWKPNWPEGTARLKHVAITSAPSLFTDFAAEDHAASTEAIATTEKTLETVLHQADLGIFVTAGDLTLSEYQALRQLIDQQQQVLVVFNKQDQYLPSERPLLLQQLRQRLRDVLPEENVVAIAAAPATRKVRQHQADGSSQERLEQPAPEIEALTTRLNDLLVQESERLILATVLRRSQALKASIQADLNQLRRDRALPVIEQYQWIAAAAAFANPVPSLDLMATAAINAQLVLDLGALYQQKFSFDQAKKVAATLATQMVKLGFVELSTQAIASLLKSNALTYAAGGVVQGISAAYLTRLAGLSLVEYFQEQSQLADADAASQTERLIQKLQAVFQRNQQLALLQNLVRQGLKRLTPEAAPASLAASEAVAIGFPSLELNGIRENRVNGSVEESSVGFSASP